MALDDLGGDGQAETRAAGFARARLIDAVEALKMRLRSASGMPMPSSATSIQTLSPTVPAVTRMWPPSGVYFTALPSTLSMTCSMRPRSP